MRVKRVAFRADAIVEFLIKRKRSIRIIEGLPEDAKLLRAHYDSNTDQYYLLFESQEFEEVVEGAVIPFLDITFSYKEENNGNTKF